MSNPLHNIARMIVNRAIDLQASAIQIELQENRVMVCCQREGVMHPLMDLPRSLHRPLVTRYKLWADADLLSRRYPLKGQFSVIQGRRHYSIEVVWEGPWPDEPRVTMCIAVGAEARAEDRDELDLDI
jgi:type II secretory ATPase GspE/PulE/Tfp pilus assembly ATPase PilB-like protein